MFCDCFVSSLQFKDSNGPNIHWRNLLWAFPVNIFQRWFSSNWNLQNWLLLLSYCTSNFLFRVVIYLNPFELICYYFLYSTALIYFPFFQLSSLRYNGRIYYYITFLSIERLLQQLEPFLSTIQDWRCKCKYRNDLSSNWYPQWLSFLKCNLDRFSPGWTFS